MHMLVAVVILALMPLPSPTPSQQPLREIGRVRAVTAFCKSILVPASSAAEIALDNDTRLVVVVANLRHYDFDSNVLVKNKNTKELTKQFVALRRAAVEGQHEVDRLRAAAKAATDKNQVAELKAFADALDGALHRQKKLADNLGSFIAYLESREPDQETSDSVLPVFKEKRGSVAGDPHPGGLTGEARDAADQFEVRFEPVLRDEDRAAAHVSVFMSCRGL